MSEWISVKDRLPEFTRTEYDWYCSDWILVWNGRYPRIATYEKYPEKEPQFMCGVIDFEPKNVTHWMPLPELPRG